MRKVNMAHYLLAPQRYELRSGNSKGAPLCPYGNHYAWIGFDMAAQAYIDL